MSSTCTDSFASPCRDCRRGEDMRRRRSWVGEETRRRASTIATRRIKVISKWEDDTHKERWSVQVEDDCNKLGWSDINEAKRQLWQEYIKWYRRGKYKKRGRSRAGEETRIIVPAIATKRSKLIRTIRRRSGKGEDNCYKDRRSDIDEANICLQQG